MALSLTRRMGQRIMIGDDIIVTVVSMDRGQVKLDIEAPADVEIHREEVRQRIEAGVPKP